jgi:hypothetical protein
MGGRRARISKKLFADFPDTRVADFSMGSWVKSEKNIVSRLLFKVDIAPVAALLVRPFHSYHAVHEFTLVFRVAGIGDFRFVLEVSVVDSH